MPENDQNRVEISEFSLPRQASPLSSFKDRMVYKVGSSIEIIVYKSFFVKEFWLHELYDLGQVTFIFYRVLYVTDHGDKPQDLVTERKKPDRVNKDN